MKNIKYLFLVFISVFSIAGVQAQEGAQAQETVGIIDKLISYVDRIGKDMEKFDSLLERFGLKPQTDESATQN